MSEIEDFMRHAITVAEAYDMPCLEGFVLEHGRAFRPVPRPAGIALGKPKNCFTNSLQTVLNAVDDESLRYVEGYVLRVGVPLLIHHAWVTVDGSDEAIDPTLPNTEDSEYWGIDFQTEYVLDVVDQHDATGFTLRQFAKDVIAERTS